MARLISALTTRHIGLFAFFSAILLGLLTISLVIVRNSVETDLVQRAALDMPLLKNRWPQFKTAVDGLHSPIIELLSKPDPLKINSPLDEKMREITEAHTYSLVGSGQFQGKIVANIEIILFEKGSLRPTTWYWSPEIDTSLRSLEKHTRVSLQQIEQTQLLTTVGIYTEPIDPAALSNERRALLFLYLHTEWNHRETLIKTLLRGSQAVALITVVAIALWAFSTTQRRLFPLIIISTSIIGLLIYSSFELKALSIRTMLSMLITLQFGPSANRAADFAGSALLAGAGFGLLLIGLIHLPASPVCPECKNGVSEAYQFCPNCNFPLKRNCSRCSAPVDTRWNYCPNCSEET